MKRITLTVVLTVFLSCFFAPSAYSWIFIDPTGVPGLDIRGLLDTVRQIDDVITKNFKNYPAAFALSNVGGYPIGDAYIGNFPHMFFGVSMTIGCANMKYFDEDVRRETSVYPAYAPNPVLYLGLGLAGGFDLLIKAMVFSDAMYRPPLDQESATLSKFNIYSGGGKLRKNLIGPITVLPGLFGFGGFTVSAGADFMEGIIGINGHYKYRLNNVFVNPPGAYYSLDFDAFYNFNCKWSMVAANAQAIGYINFLWVFDLYAGFGLAMTWGYTKLDASGLGTVSNPSLGSLGIIKAAAGYKYYPKFFMGLFIAGLEVNIWVLKITAETMVNISNGHDISLQLGTRVQF